MIHLSTFGRAGLWSALAVLLLGGLAFVAWGRAGAREPLTIVAPPANRPLLDEQTPAGLQTATFSLG